MTKDLSQNKNKLNLITGIIQLVGSVALFVISFAILQVPYRLYFIGAGVFLIIVTGLMACHWWKIGTKKPILFSILNTVVILLAAFLIGGLGSIWQHGLFKNIEAKILDFRPYPNPIEPGECTILKVKCWDAEEDVLHYQYKAEAGCVFPNKCQLPEIEYCASDNEEGIVKVSVTVFDSVERSSYPSCDAFVTVAWGGSKARQLFEEGLMKLKGKEYDKAIMKFDQTIDIAPHFADAYFGRGLAEVELGSLNNAIYSLTSNLTMPQGDSTAYLWRALSYESLGQTELSTTDYHNFLSKSKGIDAQTSATLRKEFESAGRDRRLVILGETIENSPNPFPQVWGGQTFPVPPPQL